MIRVASFEPMLGFAEELSLPTGRNFKKDMGTSQGDGNGCGEEPVPSKRFSRSSTFLSSLNEPSDGGRTPWALFPGRRTSITFSVDSKKARAVRNV